MVVFGLTLVKISLEGIVTMSGMEGYLNERAGPCGCKSVTLTLAFSISTFNTSYIARDCLDCYFTVLFCSNLFYFKDGRC